MEAEGSAGIYRGSKFSLFEGGVRVPAFISWPGKIARNQVRHQLATNIDWFPTLAAYCNIDLPQRKIDGKSLVKLIADEKESSPHDTFYWKSGGTKEHPQWAVRQGQWKLLHHPTQAKMGELDDNGLFLVNMDKDPAEKNNLFRKHPEVVKKLKELYEKWEAEVEIQ